MRAMSSDPKGRFASVTELAQALRPFQSTLGGASASGRRRAPSSPAIAAEASTQSPFTRTLTPEVDVLDGLWFEPDPPEETAGDATLPPADLSARQDMSEETSVGDAERRLATESWPAFANSWTERWRSASGRRFSARRIGAVAGGALGGLALLVLFTHGGSPKPSGSQLPVVQKESAAAKEAPLAPEPAPPSSLSASAVKEPAAPEPVVKEPAVNEPTVAKEPAVKEPAEKEPVVAKEPAAEKEPVVAKEPAAAKQPAVVEHVAKPQATPAAIRSPKAERHEHRAAPAPSLAQTPTASGAAPRDTAEKPRARTTPDVRMHNGVPLLD
jgi:hypothetical protein